MRHGCDRVPEVNVWVASCHSQHVLVPIVELSDGNPPVPIVECVLPHRVLQMPLLDLVGFVEAEDGVNDYVFVGYTFFTTADDGVSNCDVLEVTTVYKVHAINLNGREDGWESG